MILSICLHFRYNILWNKVSIKMFTLKKRKRNNSIFNEWFNILRADLKSTIMFFQSFTCYHKILSPLPSFFHFLPPFYPLFLPSFYPTEADDKHLKRCVTAFSFRSLPNPPPLSKGKIVKYLGCLNSWLRAVLKTGSLCLNSLPRLGHLKYEMNLTLLFSFKVLNLAYENSIWT